MRSSWVGTSRGGALGSGWKGSSRQHAEDAGGPVTIGAVLRLHQQYPSHHGPWRLVLTLVSGVRGVSHWHVALPLGFG